MTPQTFNDLMNNLERLAIGTAPTPLKSAHARLCVLNRQLLDEHRKGEPIHKILDNIENLLGGK